MIIHIQSTTSPAEVLTKSQPIKSDTNLKRIVIACTTLSPAAYDLMRLEQTRRGYKVFITDESGAEAHRFTLTYK